MSQLGDNVARARKARDLTQEQLAESVRVDPATIARLEQGRRRTARPDTLAKLASALGVTSDALVGFAEQPTGGDEQVSCLREAITSRPDIPGMIEAADTGELLEFSELANFTHTMWRAYVAGNHAHLLHALPSLLSEARRVVHAHVGDLHAEAQRHLATAYRLGAGTVGRYGYFDLAWTAAKTALDHGRASDYPELESAVAIRYLAWTLVRQSRFAEAERVAVAAAARIAPAMLDRDSKLAGIFGNLLFNAATAATLAHRYGRATDLLTEARAAAVRAPVDQISEAAIFGPRVAALQTIEHAVRSGEPDEAIRRAATAPDGQVPPFWEAGHQLLLGSAELELRNRDNALARLAEAADLAPEWAARQPLGRRTMRALVDRAPRRRNSKFARLASIYQAV